MNENILPKHKSDFEAVALLKQLDEEQLFPLIPELLVWLQDGNWPISREVAELLMNCGYDLVPHIKSVLASDDGQWKFFVLQDLVKQLPKEVIMELVPELMKLAMNPSDEEQAEELDELAEEVLSMIL